MKPLFAAGITFINRLSYPQKFLLVSVLFALPLALAIVLLYSETNPRITFTDRERIGIAYLQPLRQVSEGVTVSQYAAYQYRGGDTAAGITQQESLARVDSAMDQLRALDAQWGDSFETKEQFAQLVTHWGELRNLLTSGTDQVRDTHYTQIIDDIQALIARIGDTSNLILDPELETYYLMDAVLLKAPERVDLLAQAQRVGMRSATAGEPELSQAALAGLASRLQANLEATRTGMDRVFAHNPEATQQLAPLLKQTLDTSTTVYDTLMAASAGEQEAKRLQELAGGQALQDTFVLWSRATDLLDQRLQMRIDTLQLKNSLAIGVAAILILGALYILIAFYLAVMQTVRTLEAAALHMRQGDMSHTVALDNRDELGSVVRAFNTIAAALVQTGAERAAAEEARAKLQEDVIRSQSALLALVSTPLIPLHNQVVFMPVIGEIDTLRAQQMLTTLVQGVQARHAHTVMIDLTGITQVTEHLGTTLMQAIQAVRLLGARVIITGIQADVAHALVDIGVTLHGVTVYGALQEGIEHVFYDQSTASISASSAA